MSATPQATIAALDAIAGDGFAGDEVGRLAVVAAARRLLTRLQTPSEQAWGYMFNHAVIFASIQTLRDIGLWEAWTAAGAGEKTVDELVKLANTFIQPDLLRRLLRLLAAAGVITEVGEDKYTTTPFSTRLGSDLGLLIQCGTDHYNPAALAFPSFLKQTGYVAPTHTKHTPYSEMHTNPNHLEFFARMQTDPNLYASFSGHMADWTRYKPDWTTIIDTGALLATANLAEGPFVVDMSGHFGVDISRVLEKHPDLPAGSLVLQDLPEVISAVKTGSKVDPKMIKPMAFDLFKPQPVANSRAYFMHAVLHDWPDQQALEILENLKPAMKRGYSKLLICDIVIPPAGASLAQTVMDVSVMGILAAKERAQADWTELLTRGGFTGIKFHPDGRGHECVIEADLA
ncbi:O-methyltransferase-domain-containing protein [Diplogelasinospora grovesii]|uniref:O-methyltransferase-domain-containing protein n=1 Tax=Diplogelasinospora grovesii TaxID=303347 RepID=A0AAN6NCF1_9PEZI|nr:O-methyltransferase-domain-containing protein [Diplogelasinospora grovesii]